jgi:hypothetical protein
MESKRVTPRVGACRLKLSLTDISHSRRSKLQFSSNNNSSNCQLPLVDLKQPIKVDRSKEQSLSKLTLSIKDYY